MALARRHHSAIWALKKMTFLHPVRWEAALHASAGPMERGKVPSFQRAPWCAKCSPLGVIAMRKLFFPALVGRSCRLAAAASSSVVPGSSARLCGVLRPREFSSNSLSHRRILTLPENAPVPAGWEPFGKPAPCVGARNPHPPRIVRVGARLNSLWAVRKKCLLISNLSRSV